MSMAVADSALAAGRSGPSASWQLSDHTDGYWALSSLCHDSLCYDNEAQM